MRSDLPLGIVLAEDASTFTGEPVVAIAVGFRSPSTNRKTGPIVQVYVLGRNQPPSEIVKSYGDKLICGSCKHRTNSLGSCYVDVRKGPDKVWAAYASNRYVRLSASHFELMAHSVIRITAYGDCTALPFSVWEPIVRNARQACALVLGYTHHWRECNPRFRDFCMASVDTVSEQREASQAGWRTFRIRAPSSPLLTDESQCPADTHANVLDLCGVKPGAVVCSTCRSCDGGGDGGHISLLPHGVNYRRVKLLSWYSKQEMPSDK